MSKKIFMKITFKELIKLNEMPMTNINGCVKEFEELRVLSASPKSKVLQLVTKLRSSFKTNTILLTSKLNQIVNNTKFQHFIRISIILNSLR